MRSAKKWLTGTGVLIKAEGYSGGDMKHGPIALIDEKMSTMTVISKDNAYEKMREESSND
ncbi:MAG TPA: hypothetical protein ENI02_00420 [Candidatus Aminicenantes bacterium]|nr:hypothetical protein [Candidatus Aminicenantes bacterium]